MNQISHPEETEASHHAARYQGLLGVHGWMVSGVRDEGERVVVRVGKLRRGARCARCGTQSRGVHQRMRWRRVWHLAVAGQEGSLECRPRRYWCGPCQRPFTEAYEEIRTWGRRSRLSKALLLRELAGQSVGAVTRKTGLGYRAPRGVVERAEGSPPWATLLRVGIGDICPQNRKIRCPPN